MRAITSSKVQPPSRFQCAKETDDKNLWCVVPQPSFCDIIAEIVDDDGAARFVSSVVPTCIEKMLRLRLAPHDGPILKNPLRILIHWQKDLFHEFAHARLVVTVDTPIDQQQTTSLSQVLMIHLSHAIGKTQATISTQHIHNWAF